MAKATRKMNLPKQYVYAGKFYGPGMADVPVENGAADSLQERMDDAQKRGEMPTPPGVSQQAAQQSEIDKRAGFAPPTPGGTEETHGTEIADAEKLKQEEENRLQREQQARDDDETRKAAESGNDTASGDGGGDPDLKTGMTSDSDPSTGSGGVDSTAGGAGGDKLVDKTADTTTTAEDKGHVHKKTSTVPAQQHGKGGGRK